MDKHKKKILFRNISLLLGSFIITLLFLFTLVIPVFNREQYFEYVKQGKSGGVGDWDNESEAYEYWTAPPNSFGTRKAKFVNWSFFKQKFTKHTFWRLEYKRYSYSEWTEGNQYLTINRTWVEPFWKINLTFTAPVDVYEARFIFACNLSVLDYVEKDDYEVWLDYSFNATENISLLFNWSDLQQYENMYFQKGVQNNRFYFLFGRQDIPAGTYVFDPVFGHNGAGGSFQATAYDIRGTVFTMGATGGTADNISVYIRDNNAGSISAGIYLNSTKAQVGYCEEAEESVPPSSNGWRTLDIASGGTLLANTEYALGFWNNGSGMRFYYDSDANYSFHDDCNKLVYADFIAVDPVTYDSTSSQTYSIYCSYTESGAAKQWNETESWNTTLTNNTFTWDNEIEKWNVTLTNLSWNWDKEIGSWNVTLVNGTFDWDKEIESWNITLTNLTWSWDNNINLWNITLTNGTFTWDGHNINEWNVTLINSSAAEEWNNIERWNTTLTNNTFTWDNEIEKWNVTLTNLSWNWDKEIGSWNVTLVNGTSPWGNVDLWNVTLVNSSVDLITISNIYPSNNSFSIPLQPTMYLTINHTEGETMNVSWYYGLQGSENTLLGTDTNFVNSTQTELNWGATGHINDYYWRIQVDDGINYQNYSYAFRTEGYPGGGGGYIPPSSLWAISLFGLLGFVIWMVRRKKKDEDEEGFEE